MRSKGTRLDRRRVLGQLAAGAALGNLARMPAAGAGEKLESSAQRQLRSVIKGGVAWRGDSDYEATRRASVWRVNTPPRYPAVIVRPSDDADVVAAVKFARAHGLKVGTRSGGHSWTSPHLRDGAMLLDLSRMREIEVDAATQSVWTRPAAFGSEVNTALGKHGLVTPTAHHLDVGIGGFVLCGGFGWNSRLWGNGSEHILGLDVVTAEGELIRADAQQNQDYYWAARGAGAGFFGVVTRLHLAAHPMPAVWRVSVYSYPIELFDEVFTWARGIVSSVARNVELVLVTSAHDEQGNRIAPRITVAALAITDTPAQADEGLAVLDTCPVVSRATKRKVKEPTNLMERYVSGTLADPPGHRFACDNMYTNAPAAELVPRIRSLFSDLPTPRTHVFWLNWGPPRAWPDMALSVQADVFIGAYTVWDDPADDERLSAWPVQKLRELQSLSAGGQMNDENMLAHPQRYLSEAASKRLESLRARHDPHRLFVSYLTSV